jgi:hypothetical protein
VAAGAGLGPDIGGEAEAKARRGFFFFASEAEAAASLSRAVALGRRLVSEERRGERECKAQGKRLWRFFWGRAPGGCPVGPAGEVSWTRCVVGEESASKIPIDERARFFSSALRFASSSEKLGAHGFASTTEKLSSENRNGMADR